MINFIRLFFVAVATMLLTACQTMPNPTLSDVLKAQGYVAVPLRKLSTGHESIAVTINGREGLFVLDSGAGASVVHTAFATSFDLNKAVGASTNGTGAGGQIQLQRFSVLTFSLSGTSLPLTSILVTNIKSVVDSLRNAAGVDVQGVIGQDILTKFSGVIDIRAQVLYIRTEPAKSKPATET